MALSKSQKNEVEDLALRALGKRSVALVNGFRVMGDTGQVAAVYWSDNSPGNDVEIALCDIRLSEHYDLRIVRRWIEREQRLAGRECNVHKHGSDWPIIGFNYAGALDFLARCRHVRKGILDHALLNELDTSVQDIGDGNEELALALARLRPTSKKYVIDLVKAAGADVECWYKTGDNKLVANPRSNPAYCFNWSFGGNGEVVVACLWHRHLKIDVDKIVYADNLREHARKLQEVADSAGENPDIRNRAQAQARRATALDESLANAWSNGGTVRVIVNEGVQREADRLGHESSQVDARLLDPVAWRVAVYNESSGDLRLVRIGDERLPGAGTTAQQISPGDPIMPADPVAPVRFADQYTVVAADVQKTESTGSSYSRSRAVRDAALTRSAGACELCGKKGFLTKSGTIFLETHHVHPLCEGGADSEDNVAALCPDDHRKAHYSTEASEIRKRLEETLAEFYSLEFEATA